MSWWLHREAASEHNDDKVCVEDGGGSPTSGKTVSPGARNQPLSMLPPHAPPTPGNGPNQSVPLSNSLRTSRVTTPAAARPSTTGANGRGLERDESAKSDQSYFSIASVDMQEFLSEFRAARNDFLGAQCERISRNDLAEIVDRVSLPLPDVRLIADLFDEMVAPAPSSASSSIRPMSSERPSDTFSNHNNTKEHRGGTTPTDKSNASAFPPCAELTIPFEAFLARMNYKIQGRYPADAVRQVYLSLINSTKDTLTPPEAAKGTSTHPHNVVAAAKTTHVESQHAANATNGTSGVPKDRAVYEGLWLGLGIRLAPSELQRLLLSLGFSHGEGAVLQLTDFSALVAAATGQQGKDDQEIAHYA
jgi:hypothetical protein